VTMVAQEVEVCSPDSESFKRALKAIEERQRKISGKF